MRPIAQEDVETNEKELISSFSFIYHHGSFESYFTDNFCRSHIKLVHFVKILTLRFCDQTTPINNLSVLLATFSMIYSQSQSAMTERMLERSPRDYCITASNEAFIKFPYNNWKMIQLLTISKRNFRLASSEGPQ